MGYRLASPGGTELHRQAIPPGNPRNTHNVMSRLTIMYSPPGGFWKISRNKKITDTTEIMHSNCHAFHVII